MYIQPKQVLEHIRGCLFSFFVWHDPLENINFLSHLSQEKKKKLQKIIYNSSGYCSGKKNSGLSLT